MARLYINGQKADVVALGGGASGIEMLDLNLVANTYIAANGVETAYTNWSSTDYLDIEGCDVYCASTNTDQWNAYYDSSKTFISMFYGATKLTNIPNNAKYIRMSKDTSVMNNTYIFKVEK